MNKRTVIINKKSYLPKNVLFEQVRTDMSSIQVANLTPGPDLLQAEDPCSRNVGVLFGLDHNDETGVYRDWDTEDTEFWYYNISQTNGVQSKSIQ